MTKKTGKNSPKDEDYTTNMDISKCAKVLFYRYLTNNEAEVLLCHFNLVECLRMEIGKIYLLCSTKAFGEMPMLRLK